MGKKLTSNDQEKSIEVPNLSKIIYCKKYRIYYPKNIKMLNLYMKF